MPARVRGSGLRQTESRVPEVPEQEVGAATIGVRRVGKGRSDFPTVFLAGVGGGLWVVRRRSGAGGVVTGRPRLKAVCSHQERYVRNRSAMVGFGITSMLYTDAPEF